MLKETETEETIGFFAIFLSLGAFRLMGSRTPWLDLCVVMHFCFVMHFSLEGKCWQQTV